MHNICKEMHRVGRFSERIRSILVIFSYIQPTWSISSNSSQSHNYMKQTLQKWLIGYALKFGLLLWSCYLFWIKKPLIEIIQEYQKCIPTNSQNLICIWLRFLMASYCSYPYTSQSLHNIVPNHTTYKPNTYIMILDVITKVFNKDFSQNCDSEADNHDEPFCVCTHALKRKMIQC